MKWRKRIIVCICILLLASTNLPQSNAFARNVHNKYMLEVLFKHFKENAIYDKEVKGHLIALQSACYLTIDQFNDAGERDLETLKKYGVKRLPKDISSINYFASSYNHRDMTHRGWDYRPKDIKLWEKRKDILRKCVKTIFDFDGDEEKMEAFCKFIYYIHILGDHISNKEYEENKLIDVGGNMEKYDIIHEWIECVEILFKNQENTHKYRDVISKLYKYDEKFSDIKLSEKDTNLNEKRNDKEEGNNNEEEKNKEKNKEKSKTKEKMVKQYKEYSEKLMESMSRYIPEMLKNEVFFHEVFYENEPY